MTQYNLPELAADVAAELDITTSLAKAVLQSAFHRHIPGRLKDGPVIIREAFSFHLEQRTFSNPATPENDDDRVTKMKVIVKASPTLEKLFNSGE